METMTKHPDPCRECGKHCSGEMCEEKRDWLRKAEAWLHGLTYDGLPGSMLREVKKGKGPV